MRLILVVVEGLENALACWKAGVGRHVIGVPGVSRLEKVELPKGADVVFFRDGKDAPDSEAAATAGRALACWYLAGVRLRVAETPMGQDANAVLLACATEGLRRLGEEAEPYALPAKGAPKAAVDATAQRHATLRKDDPVGYERERKEVAEKLGSRTSTWDAVVPPGRRPSKRRLKSEWVERYRARRHGPRLQELCSKVARWAADYGHLLEDADPSLPEALDDRAMDNWRPLVAIADAAGGDWPERARKAALLLSSLAEDESVGVLLLADIRRVFDTKKVARIASTELSAALGAMEDSPWAEYGRVERPISSKKVALLLREFGIVPQDITLDGKRHANGYRREQFEDAWKRYPGGTSTPRTDKSPGSPSSIFGSLDHHLESVVYIGSQVRPDTPGNELQNSHNQLKTEADPKIRRLATPAHKSANSRGEGPSDTEAGAGADDNGFPDLPSEFGRCPKPAPEPPALNGDDRIVF